MTTTTAPRRPQPCRPGADEAARAAFLVAFDAFAAAPCRDTGAALDLAMLDASLSGQGRRSDLVDVLDARRAAGLGVAA